ncbi:hypothetical protein [Formivibrio citricus]|nr:hypothetical protein [Formivibrio citricus]
MLTLLLGGCATEPSAPRQSVQPGATAPAATPAMAEPAAPSVLIRGKSAAAIMSSIVKYRTQKGMKIVQRDKQRLVLSMPVPKSRPPAEARMIFSIAPAADGLLLSAQVFQIVQEKGRKPVTHDVTASLTDKLEAELAMYAK